MQVKGSTYNKVLNIGNFDLWEWDINEDCLKIIGQLECLPKYSGKAFKSPYEFINTFVIKEDRAAAINDLNLFINHNYKKYRSEMRIIVDGKIRWILLEGTHDRTEGKPDFLYGTIMDITHNKKIESEIGVFIYYDALTGLPNRTWLLENFEIEVNKGLQGDHSKAVIFIDIENLKSINNSFGYDYGDTFLKLFSQLLTACKGKDHSIYRFDGDEFVIFIPGANSRKEVEDLCSEILDYCKYPFQVKDKKIFISLSIGIAFYPEDTKNINDIFMHANLAMYQSKKEGKNRVTHFKSNLADSYLRKTKIEHELKNAIRNNELYLLFQPQFHINKNSITGFEALLRWNSPSLGMISPGEFIPIAEKTGDIVEIGEFIIKQTANKIGELLDKGCIFDCIAINVSPVQFMKKNFLKHIEELFTEKNIPLNKLEIEITEGTLIDFHMDNLSIFNDMIEKGIKIAIDDFGTGYSSLNYLTMLPISTLKIDKSFIDNISDRKNRAVIELIIKLSNTMKYNVLAEGVETLDQLQLLQEVGCEIIQGYYFSKPVFENELESMLNIYNKGGGKCEKLL
ncbi:MAG: EAL domain-containing protein [Solirubrobacterales bacterium]